MFARLRGRLQYPDDGGAVRATTHRIRGVRGRTPNGGVDMVVVNAAGLPADFQGEYWNAVFDGRPAAQGGPRWWLTGSESGAQGVFGETVAGTWNLASTNGRISFRIQNGATAFQAGDEVYINVARAPRNEGPYHLVVVAHGNHNAYLVSQPKYVEFPRGMIRCDPGAGGVTTKECRSTTLPLRMSCRSCSI